MPSFYRSCKQEKIPTAVFRCELAVLYTKEENNDIRYGKI